MNRVLQFVTVAVFLAFSALGIAAQDDRHKIEFFGGYSLLRTNTGLDEDFELDGLSGFNSHGFNASVTGNVHRYVGIKGDFAFNSRSQSFSEGGDTLAVKFRTTQFLGGLQFKDNKVDGRRVKPFAHVLAGVANQRISASGTSSVVRPGGPSLALRPDGTTGGGPFSVSGSTSNFAMAFGGGIDVKVSKRVDIRIFQFDYNPIFFRGQEFEDFEISGGTQKNFRFSFGFVIH